MDHIHAIKLFSGFILVYTTLRRSHVREVQTFLLSSQTTTYRYLIKAALSMTPHRLKMRPENHPHIDAHFKKLLELDEQQVCRMSEIVDTRKAQLARRHEKCFSEVPFRLCSASRSNQTTNLLGRAIRSALTHICHNAAVLFHESAQAP